MPSSTLITLPTAEVFAPLLAPARYKGAFGGRGSGKSHFFAEQLIEACLMEPGTRAVGIREVQKTLRESAKRLLEDKIQALKVGPLFGVQSDRIITPGGGVIIFQGMTDHTAESIKSLEGFRIAWVEEAQTLSERSLELLRPTIRAAGSQLWFSWNPRHASDPVDRFLRGDTPPGGAAVVEVNYRDNPWFPPELEAERLCDEKNNPQRYHHIWRGGYEPAVIGALWERADFQLHRRAEAPGLGRVVVGVDPAVSSEGGCHGIVVTGLGIDGRGYVLDDLSCSGKPRDWAARAVAALERWEADAIVVEVNQGGDMVKHTLQSVRRSVRIIEVRATRGKHVRAEPIAALYSLGQISHVGAFFELENQMTSMTAAGYEGTGSPDRLDALVWALTELFPRLVAKQSPRARSFTADCAFEVF